MYSRCAWARSLICKFNKRFGGSKCVACGLYILWECESWQQTLLNWSVVTAWERSSSIFEINPGVGWQNNICAWRWLWPMQIWLKTDFSRRSWHRGMKRVNIGTTCGDLTAATSLQPSDVRRHKWSFFFKSQCCFFSFLCSPIIRYSCLNFLQNRY